MKILSVMHPSFRAFGQILSGYDIKELLETMQRVIPVDENSTIYTPSQPELETLPIYKELTQRAYGGMPIQLGWCSGYNTKLNCLEYHRSSELNLGTGDFILLLAKLEDVRNGTLNTDKVLAYRVPAGMLVELYSTTLHYAPCCAEQGRGFQVLVVLPKGTNTPISKIDSKNEEDNRLLACNKWLLAHKESTEAIQGAYIGLIGKNIDLKDEI